MNHPSPVPTPVSLFQLCHESSREYYNQTVNMVSNLTPKKLAYLWGKAKDGESMTLLGKGMVREIVEKCIQYLDATIALLESRDDSSLPLTGQQDGPEESSQDKQLQQALFQTRELEHILARFYHIHTILSLYYAQIYTEGISSFNTNTNPFPGSGVDNTLVTTLQDLARLLVQEIMPRFQWSMSSVSGGDLGSNLSPHDDSGGIHASRIAHKSPIQLRRDVDLYLNAMNGMQRFAKIAYTLLHSTLPYVMARAKLGQIIHHHHTTNTQQGQQGVGPSSQTPVEPLAKRQDDPMYY